ncbi:MAG: hypothetical protein DYH13_09845 [Alphaproteobacteria bacterium PRO2]|nr:hypothetical protein [Alphaproteobacteria bacterium PRO2]
MYSGTTIYSGLFGLVPLYLVVFHILSVRLVFFEGERAEAVDFEYFSISSFPFLRQTDYRRLDHPGSTKVPAHRQAFYEAYYEFEEM